MCPVDIVCVLAHLQKFGGDEETDGLQVVEDSDIHVLPLITLCSS